MKGKLLIIIVSIALLAGLLSGCVEEEKPKNKAPTASITCIESGYIGEAITFADASTDTDGTIANWTWDLGDDGVIDSFDQDFIYTFTAENTYTISLIVTDDDGAASEKDICSIEITYEPPTATITAEYEGENITANSTSVWLNSTITEGAGTIMNYTWDFGDGSALVFEVDNTTHIFVLAGTITVTLTVTDTNQKEAIASIELTVQE